ncbi:hypothetical protein [Deinococcus sp.]|uniref:hypothetical protein n=1 Tax=Deinococcus sp. TaxID=47478 RepID=UPI003C7C9850
MFRFLLLAPLLTLLACAPAQSRAEVSKDVLFVPGGQQLAQICAGRGRVAQGGTLVWDSGDLRESRQAPYLVSCYDFTLKNDGATLQVQDDTLGKALTHFDPDSRFLVYFGDLAVRFPTAGLLGADPTGSVPDAQRNTLRGVSVTASQPGQPDLDLIRDGAVTAQRYDPAQPLTLHLKAARSPVAWPEVTVQAGRGLISAPVYR